MSHRKDDIDEQAPKPGDLLLVDLLYGELSDDARERAAQTLEEDALEPDLAALSDLRTLFRQLPQEEPPAAVTAKLLHAAALHAPSIESGAPDRKPGFWTRLSNLFRPVLMYPGLAAAASLVLIVLVGGTIYMAGDTNTHEPELIPASPAPRAPASESRAATDTPAASPAETLAQDSTLPDAPDSAEHGNLPAEQEAEPAAGTFAGELSAPSGTTRPRDSKKRKDSQTATRSASSRSSRTARVYEGDALAPNSSPADDRGAGSAAGRAGSISQANAPAADAEPKKAEAPAAEGGLSLSATDESTAQQERAAPPPKPATAPSRKQAKSSKKKSADKSTGESDLQPRIRSLHSEARTAASQGDCKTVNEAGSMIQNLDARYYRDVFRKDRGLAVCLSAKTSQE